MRRAIIGQIVEVTGDGQELAKRGHSKEKRFDCPLITLALMLDGNGFVQRSREYPGNVCDFSTLEAMLADLEVPPEAMLVMDREMSTEENLTWLRANDYKYLVVDRRQAREFDAEEAVEITTRKGDKVQIQLVEQADERILYCRSWARVKKKNAMLKQKMEDFQTKLKDISDGLQRPRTRKKLPFVSERIGRLKQDLQHGVQTLRSDRRTRRGQTQGDTHRLGAQAEEPLQTHASRRVRIAHQCDAAQRR